MRSTLYTLIAEFSFNGAFCKTMALYLRKDNSMQSVIAIKWLW
jgi:hypothetical protein